ncbi:hypothetical protein E5288_WYG001945 [Bos mutus]|uniref:Uncharacterized protein n=1 Tax=Bos mutus TaxID=72004 RepID=A0A6B0RL81_9CETA|nr:hypothetical protein [Bos mutus]
MHEGGSGVLQSEGKTVITHVNIRGYDVQVTKRKPSAKCLDNSVPKNFFVRITDASPALWLADPPHRRLPLKRYDLLLKSRARHLGEDEGLSEKGYYWTQPLPHEDIEDGKAWTGNRHMKRQQKPFCANQERSQPRCGPVLAERLESYTLRYNVGRIIHHCLPKAQLCTQQ